MKAMAREQLAFASRITIKVISGPQPPGKSYVAAGKPL